MNVLSLIPAIEFTAWLKEFRYDLSGSAKKHWLLSLIACAFRTES